MNALLLALSASALFTPDPTLSYRFEMRVVGTNTVPVLGDVEGSTRTLGISHFTKTASGFEHQLKICDVSLEGGGALVETRVPSAFVSALKPNAAKLKESAGLLEIDLGEEYIGFRENRASEWPPRTRRSPGVTDSDDDGRPGATLELRIANIGRVNVLIAQRARAILLGAARGDALEGRVEMRELDQRVLATEPAIFNLQTSFSPSSDKSWFRISPLGQSARCEDLK